MHIFFLVFCSERRGIVKELKIAKQAEICVRSCVRALVWMTFSIKGEKGAPTHTPKSGRHRASMEKS